MLEHHYIAKQKNLRRYYVDDETYDYLEKEADYYAQLILVPHACLCSFNITNAKHIALLCKISDAAAKRRFYDYQIWHSHMSKEDNYDNSIFYLFFDFSFKRKCKKCKHIVIQRYGKYCIFCGKKQLEWSNEKIVYYPKLPTYDNGKLKMCPVCKNEETSITGQYCQICSARLVNTCSNFNCNTLLPTNARFCPICGSRSVFFNSNFLSDWNVLDGFMVIPDGIEDNSSDIDEELPFN
jgi:RNA polymerase subunit RPABC4/transcription elongation factor Spt4